MSSKQREALEQIHLLLSISGKPDTAMCIRYETAFQIAKEALTEPIRNCDIGSPEEQDERFKNFCLSYYEPCNVDGECWKCPLFKTKTRCPIAWSQMPYESEVK